MLIFISHVTYVTFHEISTTTTSTWLPCKCQHALEFLNTRFFWIQTIEAYYVNYHLGKCL